MPLPSSALCLSLSWPPLGPPPAYLLGAAATCGCCMRLSPAPVARLRKPHHAAVIHPAPSCPSPSSTPSPSPSGSSSPSRSWELTLRPRPLHLARARSGRGALVEAVRQSTIPAPPTPSPTPPAAPPFGSASGTSATEQLNWASAWALLACPGHRRRRLTSPATPPPLLFLLLAALLFHRQQRYPFYPPFNPLLPGRRPKSRRPGRTFPMARVAQIGWQRGRAALPLNSNGCVARCLGLEAYVLSCNKLVN